MPFSQDNKTISGYIFSTWTNWTVSVGLVCVLVGLSPYVSRLLLPYVAYALGIIPLIMLWYRRQRHNRSTALLWIAAITLLLSGTGLTALNLTASITDVYQVTGKPVNENLPYVVQLMLSPIIAALSGAFLVRRLGHGRFFRTSCGRVDVPPVQRMVWQETRYQVRLLFIITTILAVVTWFYCFKHFVTASFNSSDLFFFVWMPVVVYILSVIYLWFRCVSLWAFYIQTDTTKLLHGERMSIIRFLIVADNSLYLTRHQIKVKQDEAVYFDTPVRITLKDNPTKRIPDAEARRLFVGKTGLEPRSLRFLFKCVGLDRENTVFHFLCDLDSTHAIASSRIKGGEWLKVQDLTHLDRLHMLSAELSAELVHIFTVARAWKSYHRDGRRRYEIRGYKPSVNLGEIKDWDVDFNDTRWLKVARLNADSPFFKLRLAWRRLLRHDY